MVQPHKSAFNYRGSTPIRYSIRKSAVPQHPLRNIRNSIFLRFSLNKSIHVASFKVSSDPSNSKKMQICRYLCRSPRECEKRCKSASISSDFRERGRFPQKFLQNRRNLHFFVPNKKKTCIYAGILWYQVVWWGTTPIFRSWPLFFQSQNAPEKSGDPITVRENLYMYALIWWSGPDSFCCFS